MRIKVTPVRDACPAEFTSITRMVSIANNACDTRSSGVMMTMNRKNAPMTTNAAEE